MSAAVAEMALVAVLCVCVTAVTCTWIVAERWYAHRDRSYARLVASTEVSTALAISDVTKMATQAAARLDAYVADDQAKRTALEKTVKELEEREQQRQRDAVFGRRT